jgi:hypothetical protein
MKDSRAVAGRTEQTRTSLQIDLGLFPGRQLVQGVVAMTLPDKLAANLATSHHSMAPIEVDAR